MTHDALHTLVSLTRQHLLQEYEQSSLISCEKDTFDFFKSSYKAPVSPKPIAEPITIVPQPLPKPQPKPQIKPPIQQIQAPVPQVEVSAAVDIVNPSLSALCRPLSHSLQPQLLDVGQKLNQENVQPPNTVVTPIWKDNYPECAIISFFSDNSFYQKMAQAITERLHKNSHLLTPTLESAAALVAYTCSLKAIIVAYDPTSVTKAKTWISQLPELETIQKDLPPFTCKKSLYGTCIYELQLQENPSAEEKSILWKALQQLLIPSVK